MCDTRELINSYEEYIELLHMLGITFGPNARPRIEPKQYPVFVEASWEHDLRSQDLQIVFHYPKKIDGNCGSE